MAQEVKPPQTVLIDYTNWRGERSRRVISPVQIWFAPNGTEFHKEAGWYLTANTETGVRDFAMKDIHSWNSIAYKLS
jgi:hypothetical protein